MRDHLSLLSAKIEQLHFFLVPEVCHLLPAMVSSLSARQQVLWLHNSIPLSVFLDHSTSDTNFHRLNSPASGLWNRLARRVSVRRCTVEGDKAGLGTGRSWISHRTSFFSWGHPERNRQLWPICQQPFQQLGAWISSLSPGGGSGQYSTGSTTKPPRLFCNHKGTICALSIGWFSNQKINKQCFYYWISVNIIW